MKVQDNGIDTSGLGIVNENYGMDGKHTIVEKGLSDDLIILEKAFEVFNKCFFDEKLETPVISISSNMRCMVKATKPDDWVKYENGNKDRKENCIGIQISEKVLELDMVGVYVQLVVAMLMQYDIEKKEYHIAKYGSSRGYKSLTAREGNYYSKKFVEICRKCLLDVENYEKGKGTVISTQAFVELLKQNGLLEYKITCNREKNKKNNVQNKKLNGQSMVLYKCPICGMKVRVTKKGTVKLACYNGVECNGVFLEKAGE